MANPFRGLNLPKKVTELAHKYTNAGGRLDGGIHTKNLFRRAGENLNPKQREALLEKYPEVSEKFGYELERLELRGGIHNPQTKITKGYQDAIDAQLVSQELDSVARPLKLTDDTTTFGDYEKGVAVRDLDPNTLFGDFNLFGEFGTGEGVNLDAVRDKLANIKAKRFLEEQAAEKQKKVVDLSKFQGLLAPSAAPLAAGLLSLPSQDVGAVQATQSPTAGLLADTFADYNRRVEQRPLLQFIAPQAPEDLARKFQYGKPRTYGDYVSAATGLLF